MWNFLPGGLLMPSIVPTDEDGNSKAKPELTNNGEYMLQVRARVESHLTNFIRDYMDPYGLPHSEIELTPDMDYNARFYTTHEVYAEAMKNAILDIDYAKFKPTAERMVRNDDGTFTPLYADGKKYHSILNTIWGSLTRLAPAGGVWGSYDPVTNPRGYRARSWSGKGSGPKVTFENSAFRSTDPDDILAGWDEDASWNRRGFDVIDAYEDEDFDAWYSDRDVKTAKALAKVEGIPEDQWDEFLTTEELDLVEDLREDAWKRRAEEFKSTTAPVERGRRRKHKSKKSKSGRRFYHKH